MSEPLATRNMLCGLDSVCSLILLVAILAGAAPTQAQQTTERPFAGTDEYRLPERRALVIGISSVDPESGLTSLNNPVNDAKRVSEELDKIGFDVTNLTEDWPQSQLTRQFIKKAVYDFAQRLKSSGAVGLIYFAGHGVEVDQRLYVVPYDGYVRFKRDVAEELIPISLFFDAFKYAGNPLNLLILDTCRDNPLGASIEEFGKGLTPAPPANSAPEDEIFATSTLSGSKASDGSDNSSPFASAFVDELANDDEDAGHFFNAISRNVADLVEQGNLSEKQVPNVLLLGRDFVFVPTRATFEQEQRTFDRAKISRNPKLFRNLKREFAGGYFYLAADAWLKNPPPAPTSPQAELASTTPVGSIAQPNTPPQMFLRLAQASYLRGAPSLDSAALTLRPAGTQLAAFGDVEHVNGSNWYSVRSEDGLSAYVRTDRVIVTKREPQTVRLDLGFLSGTGVQTLADESVAALRNVAKDEVPVVTKLEIIGFKLQSDDRKVDDRTLLERQATAAAALTEAGYEAANASIATVLTSDPALDGAVQVTIN